MRKKSHLSQMERVGEEVGEWGGWGGGVGIKGIQGRLLCVSWGQELTKPVNYV